MNYSCGKYIEVTPSQKQTMTAYEELKAWCEKHLGDKYRIETIPETTDCYTTMYIIKSDEEIFYAAFDTDEYFIGFGSAPWDEFQEHIEQAEKEGKIQAQTPLKENRG